MCIVLNQNGECSSTKFVLTLPLEKIVQNFHMLCKAERLYADTLIFILNEEHDGKNSSFCWPFSLSFDC